MRGRDRDRLLLFTLLVTLVAVVASSTPVAGQDEDDREVREREVEYLYILGPGEEGRLEIEMFEAGGLVYVLDSGQRPVELHMFREDDGNLTSHLGPRRTTDASGTFVAPADGVYVFHTQRVLEREATIRLTLEGEFGIVGLEGIEPAQEVPAPGFLPGVLVTALVALGVRVRRGLQALE